MVLLEVCVDSILSAVNASQAGAARIELCSALSEGGLTPSVGLFKGVKKAIGHTKTKIFCMIRIRRGDFNFSDDEIDAMIEDVKYFQENGVDGIVFGCLDEDSKIHFGNCQKISTAWGGGGKSLTFHRAFDETNKSDFKQNIEHLVDLGFDRILSSGFESSAKLGIENLKNLVDYCDTNSITIMPGAGITGANVAKIVSESGCKEVHASARSSMKSSIVGRLSMGGGSEDLQPLLVCDQSEVKELIQNANSV